MPQVVSRRMSDYVKTLNQHLEKLKNMQIAIIGDVGLDEYVWGQVRRISPEAPVPVVEVEREESRLGLAANVAQNVSGLGGIAHLFAVIGADATSERFKGLLKEANVSSDHLITDSKRPTTRKLRVMSENHHIVRVDFEDIGPLSNDTEKKLLEKFEKNIQQFSAVIIQDYAKGVVSAQLVKEVVRIAKREKKPVLADPHRTRELATYQGVDLMTPNTEEALSLVGLSTTGLRPPPSALVEVGENLMKAVGSQRMVITRGKEGMRLFDQGMVIDIPTHARQVFDVTGAGDTVIATIAMGLAAGCSLEEASALANVAAGIVVAKVGCVPCTISELKSELKLISAS